MSTWDVHLVFIDDKSKKFWRARRDGTNLVVNWGRIGSDGQEKVHAFGDAAACTAELQKLAGSKERKGYVRDGGAAPTEAPAIVEEAVPDDVTLSLDHGGRRVEVRLELEDQRLKTLVVETHDDVSAARATLRRVKKALEADGYR